MFNDDVLRAAGWLPLGVVVDTMDQGTLRQALVDMNLHPGAPTATSQVCFFQFGPQDYRGYMAHSDLVRH